MRVLAASTLAIQKRIFWILIIFIVTMIALYVYFVSKSITNVLLREEIETKVADVNSDISALEFSYLEEKDAISLELAYEKGFHPIAEKSFVARKTFLGTRLTVNNEI